MGNNRGEFVAGKQSDSEDSVTIRDYFAAKAMAAILANDEWVKRIANLECYKGINSGLCISKEAYVIADAMLAERAK